MSLLNDILIKKSPTQTVFTIPEIAMFGKNYTGKKLHSALKYLVKNKDMIRISQGIYALNNEYSQLEFANKYRSPSYVSFYTVLAKNGVIFQYYSSIFLASSRSEEKKIDKQNYIYRKLRDEILLNPLGIEESEEVSMATTERAICDKLYLDGNEYFDNLRAVDFEKVKEINNKVFGNNKAIRKWISQNTK